MKQILVLIAALFISSMIFCQDGNPDLSSGPGYNRAIGIKFPGGFAVTYKKFIRGNNALEAMAEFASHGIRFSGLYEFHHYNITADSDLGWFVGPGAHIGIWNNAYRTEKNFDTQLDIGIDGIIGLDYKFKGLPINISLDWHPAISLAGSTGFDPASGGIGVRYTF
ncbi:MAG: hypothetical protein JWN76_382 [Chitinophagaceae bacterium]|nr:hypothetical protein [Chitinophagaceae bacterium]